MGYSSESELWDTVHIPSRPIAHYLERSLVLFVILQALFPWSTTIAFHQSRHSQIQANLKRYGTDDRQKRTWCEEEWERLYITACNMALDGYPKAEKACCVTIYESSYSYKYMHLSCCAPVSTRWLRIFDSVVFRRGNSCCMIRYIHMRIYAQYLCTQVAFKVRILMYRGM